MGSARRGSTGPWAVKDHQQLVKDTETGAEEGGLKRAVGALDLTALGIGAVIGTGIFVVIGEGIGEAGPAVILSFLLAALTCFFSALCYAELASSIPVSGSAYTYAYATLGELVAWIIGWDLILEYGVSVAAVAVGWGGNLNEFLENAFGYALPESISTAREDGGILNLPAVAIVIAVMFLLSRGVRETARANLIMVFVKLADPRLLHRRGLHRGVLRRQPDAVRAGGRRRRGQRGGDHLLRLHRLRRGVDGSRGSEEPEARPAAGDRRLAGDLHDHLHPHLDRGRRLAARDRAREVRRAAGGRARRGRRHQLGRLAARVRRADRDHVAC